MGEASDPEQQYSLRWNDFHASILSSFRHLRDEEDFVDVTLACDGCSFQAHKVVLSACSPYFRRLLKANPCPHPIVILRDVREKDMESLLRFMYNGEVHIGQEQLSDFLKTAQMLQVRGLADVPTKDNQKSTPTSNSLPWSQSGELREHFQDDALSPPPKRNRTNEHRFSPSPASSATNNNNNGDTMMRDTLLGQALEGSSALHSGGTQHQNKGNSDSSLQAQSTGEDSNSSDTALSDRGPIVDLIRPKSEPNDYGSVDENNHHPGNGNLGMDVTRTPTFPAALLGLQGLPGFPGPSGLHNSNQDTSFGAGTDSGGGGGMSGPCRSFECPLCDAVVIELPAMRAHLEEHYPRDSPTCPVASCAKAFSHPNSVRNHMRMKHSQQWDKMKTLKWSYM